VLTDEAFYALLSKEMTGKLSRDIRLVYCPLTADLAERVRIACLDARNEINRGKRIGLGENLA
jgi:hypothetical protein